MLRFCFKTIAGLAGRVPNKETLHTNKQNNLFCMHRGREPTESRACQIIAHFEKVDTVRATDNNTAPRRPVHVKRRQLESGDERAELLDIIRRGQQPRRVSLRIGHGRRCTTPAHQTKGQHTLPFRQGTSSITQKQKQKYVKIFYHSKPPPFLLENLIEKMYHYGNASFPSTTKHW